MDKILVTKQGNNWTLDKNRHKNCKQPPPSTNTEERQVWYSKQNLKTNQKI